MNRNRIEITYNSYREEIVASNHFHEYYEILIILSDVEAVFINNALYPAEKCTAYLLSDMDLHRGKISEDGKYDYIAIHFFPEFLDVKSQMGMDILTFFHKDKNGHNKFLHLDDSQLEILRAHIDKTKKYSEMDEHKYGKELFLKIGMIEIILFLNSLILKSEPQNILNNSENFSKVEPIITFIQDNLSDDLSLEKLSDRFYMSKFYLSRLFKKATGFTLNEFIISKRMIAARKLLKDDISIQMVGEKVGYNNCSHFIRTFKKIMGTTPKQYIKTHLQN